MPTMVVMLRTVLFILLLPLTALADKNLVEPADGDSWDCGTDPVVNINYASAKIALTGACTTVNINGNAVKTTIEDVAELNVNGAKTVTAVTKLGKVAINGASNKVTWKQAKTGKKPGVTTNGRGNAVKKVK